MRSAGHIVLTCIFLSVIFGGLWYMSKTTGTGPTLDLPETPEKQRIGSPPTPEDLPALSAELREMIQRQVERISERTDDADRRGTLGMMYQANGMYELALAAYDQAQKLEPINPKWVYLHGIAHELLGNLDQAAADMRTVTELRPEFSPAFLRLGVIEMHNGNLDDAATALQYAERLLPDDPATITAVAQVRIKLGFPNDVPVLLEPFISAPSYEPYVRHVLAGAYDAMGEPAKAAAMRMASSDEPPPWYDEWTFRIPEYRVKSNDEATVAPLK